MITKVEGFILSEVNYGETSKVINVLTKEYGLVGMMCRGVKSMKSRLRALTLRFTYGFFYIYKKEGKLSILKDVDVIDGLQHIHSNIVLLGYLNYLSDLTYQVYKECESDQIFPLFLEVVKKMNQGLSPVILTNILEIKYLDFLGVSLNLDSCIRCGRTDAILTIDADSGGYLCKNCVKNEKIVSLKTVKMIRMYYYVDVKSISSLHISDEVSKDIDDFLTKYYDRFTGIYLKSKEFIGKLEKL